ncbi:MAG: FHA domain-containing protein, partial [Planctomycetota bacterium]
MARLILEEDGATRRFNLSQGKLTFGSSDKATLTLASDEVAALHGQIEMGEEGAVVRVAKGVQPIRVGGRAVQGAHVMKGGQAVSIGGAKLTIEYDEGEGPASGSSSGAAATRSA